MIKATISDVIDLPSADESKMMWGLVASIVVERMRGEEHRDACLRFLALETNEETKNLILALLVNIDDEWATKASERLRSNWEKSLPDGDPKVLDFLRNVYIDATNGSLQGVVVVAQFHDSTTRTGIVGTIDASAAVLELELAKSSMINNLLAERRARGQAE